MRIFFGYCYCRSLEKVSSSILDMINWIGVERIESDGVR